MDSNIAIWQSVFRYFSNVFMAFIWVVALEHKFEIWVSYCRLLSKVTPNTLILSEDGIVFPSTEIDIGGLPNLSREMNWNLSGFAPYSYYQTMKLHDEHLFLSETLKRFHYVSAQPNIHRPRTTSFRMLRALDKFAKGLLSIMLLYAINHNPAMQI